MTRLHDVARGLLALAAFAGLGVCHAQAPESGATDKDRATTAKLVYGLMSERRYEYRAKPFDDALSSQVFDAYVEALDPRHESFSAADLRELDRYREKLDDAVKRGALEPIYEIADAQQQSAQLGSVPRSRDEVLEIFLNAYIKTVDARARYVSPFVAGSATKHADTHPKAASAATQSTLEIGGKRVGVITVGSFYGLGSRSVSQDVARHVEALKHARVDGVVLDLRASPGGAFREVVSLAGLFLGASPVIQIRETGGRVSVEKADTAASWDGPLAVLVDRETSSGAEMVAAAIQDRGRGLVVGEQTSGLGTIQNPVDLDRGAVDGRRPGERRFGWISITIAETFRLDGRPLDVTGVVPDVPMRMGEPSLRDLGRSPVSPPIPAVRGHVAPTDHNTAALLVRHQARSNQSKVGPDGVLAEAATILVDSIELQSKTGARVLLPSEEGQGSYANRSSKNGDSQVLLSQLDG